MRSLLVKLLDQVGHVLGLQHCLDLRNWLLWLVEAINEVVSLLAFDQGLLGNRLDIGEVLDAQSLSVGS